MKTEKMKVLLYLKKSGLRPLQNLTSFSIILVFEYNWLTCSLYF